MLRRLQDRSEGRGDPKAMGDAIALAMLIEQLAQEGQKRDAAEAIGLALRVESLIDTLTFKVDALLAP